MKKANSTQDRPGVNEQALRRQGAWEKRLLLSLATPAFLAIVAVIVIPVGWLFYLSFLGGDGQFSLENYQKMIKYKSSPHKKK